VTINFKKFNKYYITEIKTKIIKENTKESVIYIYIYIYKEIMEV